ncbi:hypothetical protein MKW92_005232 [Papaver armeniacum]|nr:hypothetical protein MKW92_005232 [Papaver armeniacum]
MASFFAYHLIFTLSLLRTFTYSTAEDPWWSFCNDNKKINSTKISSNIDDILPKLVSQTSSQGYTFLSSGSGNDRVLQSSSMPRRCSKHQKNAPSVSKKHQSKSKNYVPTKLTREFCTNSNWIISNGIIYANVQNVNGDSTALEKVLGDLTDKITGQTKLSEFETLYSLVQCTRDLSKFACSQCLATAVGNYGFCKDKKGCRSIYSSCFVRYELYPIFYPVNSINSTDKNVYSRHMLHP